MSTLTLEMPDALLALLESRADAAGEDRQRFAVTLLEEMLEDDADDVRAAVEEALAEDPADSILLEDYIEQVKRERRERDAKATAA